MQQTELPEPKTIGEWLERVRAIRQGFHVVDALNRDPKDTRPDAMTTIIDTIVGPPFERLLEGAVDRICDHRTNTRSWREAIRHELLDATP